jgi:hypothetical protein
VAARGVDGRDSVADGVHPVAELGQHELRDLPVQRVALREQYAQRLDDLPAPGSRRSRLEHRSIALVSAEITTGLVR